MTLEKACKELLVKDPFYGLFLMGLHKTFDDAVETAGVCLNGINTELHVNQKFWDELNDETQLAVIKHELNHLLYHHVTEIWNDYNEQSHQLLNVAMDCEVNSSIPALQKEP